MGKLDVHISHGSGSGWLIPVVALSGLAILGTGGATGVVSGVSTALEWIGGAIFFAVMVLIVALAVVYRRGRLQIAHRGDPRARLDAIEAEKRAELAKIRLMSQNIEAAQLAGIEITPAILQLLQNPELYHRVLRMREAANLVNQLDPGQEVQ